MDSSKNMPIDTPAQQAVAIVMYSVLYPIVVGVPLGMFLKVFVYPFRLFVAGLYKVKGR